MGIPGGSSAGALPDASQLPSLVIDAPARPRTPSGATVADEGSIQEHGRTYHHYNPDTYLMPNDADEQSRLDLQHHVQLLLLDGDLYKAPIANPRSALDLGTGTGIWAIQFAQIYPECSVVGSDLSLIQPTDIAPNTTFIREDADKDEWTFNRTFDYIHARAFCGFITDIKRLLKKAYDHLEPGGWLELQEFTHEIFPATQVSIEHTAFATVVRAFAAVMVEKGCNPYVMGSLRDLLAAAGFVDIQQQVQHMPIGDWAADPKYKAVGTWHAANVERALGQGGRSGPLFKTLLQSGMNEGQIAHLEAHALQEIRGLSDPRVFMEYHYYVVFGRKPLAY